MKQVILLKLGEVVLKGQNRYRFEQLLLKNIRLALADIGPVELRSIPVSYTHLDVYKRQSLLPAAKGAAAAKAATTIAVAKAQATAVSVL